MTLALWQASRLGLHSAEMKVFLSAVSNPLRPFRDALATDLRAIGCVVKVQEDFQQGSGKLIDYLQEVIDECDRVIALIGDAFGYEAEGVPAHAPQGRSYTQWEYFFAQGERINGAQKPPKQLFVYFTSAELNSQSISSQSEQYAARQSVFANEIRTSGKHWAEFSSADQLCRRVLRDGWQMEQRPERQPNNLPFGSIGSLFKGREPFTERIRHSLNRGAHRTAATTVHGLSGTGKTRLSVEYALQHASDYSALLFVTADSPDALDRNLAALCDSLVLDLPEQDAAEEEIRVGAAIRWLQKETRWLLVLDNADSADAMSAVEQLVPHLGRGHVLVTSTNSEWPAEFDAFELDVLAREASVAFLLERTAGARVNVQSDEHDAAAIANEIGDLALALEQSAAYVRRFRISFAEYLTRWRDQQSKVRSTRDARSTKESRGVGVTWRISFEQLSAGAQAVLRVLSWFAADPVPRDAVTRSRDGELWKPVFAGTDAHGDPQSIEEFVAELAGLSLLKFETGNSALRMHRLVAEAARAQAGVYEKRVSLDVAVELIATFLLTDVQADDVRAWPRWQPMESHVVAVLNAAEKAQQQSDIQAILTSGLGVYLTSRAQFKRAETLIRRSLAINESIFGVDAPETATGLHNLAHLLQTTNRLGEAETLMRRALAISEAQYGPMHEALSVHLSNLSHLLNATNRREEAEALVRRALAIDEKSLGAHHPAVALRLNNLAMILSDTDHPQEAESLMQRALAIDEAAFGPDHPTVASSLNNLAELFKVDGRLTQAEPLLQRALSITEASYGPDHPETAVSLNNLAMLLYATHRTDEAERMIKRALAINEASYGSEHRIVGTGLSNLGQMLEGTGRTGEAVPITRRALDIASASYAADHPTVINRLTNLVRMLIETEQWEEAATNTRRLLDVSLNARVKHGARNENEDVLAQNMALLLQKAGIAEVDALQQVQALYREHGL